jgi:tetratricopeptide (TPR) repeat protein
VAVAAAVLVARVAAAQEAAEEEAVTASPAAAEAALETYLARLGLNELRADHLEARLRQAPAGERRAMAERLAAIYVERLGRASTAESRAAWEERGRELLRLVPEAESYDLRIGLARAVYVRAEEQAERVRLRLARPEEAAEAERMLRSVKAEFTEVAGRLHSRVEQLERQEQAGREVEQASRLLEEARRQRSLAFYYAGWTDLYLGMLTGNERLAVEAMKSFGWLLNARGGVPASLERLPAGLLKYEHIARAAIGCALAASMRGNDVEAMRWLDAVGESPEVAEPVRSQLLARRITVLAAAKRWADLDREIRRARKADRAGGGPTAEPLPTAAARLLAVVALEADRRVAGDLLGRLAQTALGDLVARGETGQLLDLVQRYGTAPIGETGFIVNYVRGVQAFERARGAHRAGGGDASEPARDAALVDGYRQAASLLDAALRQDDAASFGSERSRASLLAGEALYYAGDFAGAADRFLAAARGAARPEDGEEPMWLALSSLDRAAKGGGGGASAAAAKRRDETAALFLRTYPGSARSAQILISLGSSALLDDEAAVTVLLGVPRGSPSYEAARRQAARLLYGMYRAAGPERREFAAMRFVTVAEELLADDLRRAMVAEGAEGREVGERVVLRVRQVLDAVLSTPTADPARAQAALETLDRVAAHVGIDLAPYQGELLYRRVQVHVARGEMERGAELCDLLRDRAGTDPAARPFADSAERLVYRAALAAWQRTPESAEARALVIRHGERIIGALGSTPAALADAATLTLHTVVADAAFRAWQEQGSTAMRDLSIRLDRAVLGVQGRYEPSLRRLSASSEAAGDAATALGCWRTLEATAATGTPAWFEARWNVLRLLGEVDPAAARAEMQRHRLLYPDGGPEPWGERIRAIGGGTGWGGAGGGGGAAASPRTRGVSP